jgi:hypothetical protein
MMGPEIRDYPNFLSPVNFFEEHGDLTDSLPLDRTLAMSASNVMSGIGTSRRFAMLRNFDRNRCMADIDQVAAWMPDVVNVHDLFGCKNRFARRTKSVRYFSPSTHSSSPQGAKSSRAQKRNSQDDSTACARPVLSRKINLFCFSEICDFFSPSRPTRGALRDRHER